MDGLYPDHREPGEGAKRVRFVNYYTLSSNHAASYLSRAGHERWRLEYVAARMEPRTASAEFEILSRPSNETDEEEKLAKDSTSSMSSSDEKKCGSSTNQRPETLPPSAIMQRWSLGTTLHMEAADEILAHQSIFLTKSSHYDHLVGDTAAWIECWIQDELTQQVILSGKF